MTEPSDSTHPARLPEWTFGPRPDLCVALLILAQIVIWTLTPYLAGTSLPLDVVSDGLGWGHEWQWGYYKHPPLPSWEAELFFDSVGDIGPYLLSQISIGFTYALIFLFGREIMPAKWALAGTLLTACVYYFSIPTPEFNHNVAQMPLWAAAVYAYFRAVHARALRWWLLLGAVAGFALLTKYASAILFLVMTIHLLYTPDRRACFKSGGPYAALLICILIVSPHLVWLYDHHFPTLSYATHRAGQVHGLAFRILAPVRFLLSQLLDISPALLVSGIAGFLGRETFRRFPFDEKLRFLATFAVGPAMLTALLSLVTGMGLRDMWGAPMWNMVGLLVVYACQPRWERVAWSRLIACVGAIFVLMPLAYVLATATIPTWERKPSRTQWPDRAMAEAFATSYARETGKPLRIVASDGWLAGLVAMRDPSRPSVFSDGNPQESPWITPERLAREGALVLWRADKPVSPRLFALKGLKMMGSKIFAWPGIPDAKPLTIGWGIVPPQNGEGRKYPS